MFKVIKPNFEQHKSSTILWKF